MSENRKQRREERRKPIIGWAVQLRITPITGTPLEVCDLITTLKVIILLDIPGLTAIFSTNKHEFIR